MAPADMAKAEVVQLATANTPSAAEAGGRNVFVSGACSACHTVKAAGLTREGPAVGPDLSQTGKRFDRGGLDAWVRKGAARNGKVHAFRFAGTEADWLALSRWLLQWK